MKLVRFVLALGRFVLVRSGNLPGIVIRASGWAAIGLFCLLSAFQAWSADCVPPPAGIVSWWPGEGNANDIVDGNSGVLANGVTFAPGMVGQAFSFNGTSSYIQIGDSPKLHFTNALTIEAWIYLTRQGGYYNIVSKWDWSGANAQKGYATAVVPGGQISLGVCNDGDCAQGPRGSSAYVWSANSIPVNQWTHFAGTYDGSNLWIYVNGVCENQTAYNSGIFPGTNDLLIGAAAASGGQVVSPFAGLIDEPAVYNRALSAAEIRAIYNAGSAGKCRQGPVLITSQPQGQVGYWGKSVTLTVTGIGTTPFSYQWLKDGTPLGGASGSSLVLTNLQLTDAGNYSVVITNAYGSTTSSNAYLTMNPAGVSLALYSGITIDGVVGLTYGIQYNTDLSNTKGWRGMANVTLGAPSQLWFDVQPADQPPRSYRVVPGPITIP
jgi:hypothetical protein